MSEMSYLPPQPPPPPPPAESTAAQFDFAKPFTFVLEDPRWMPKILVGGLFYLASIFIIGLLFVLGYAARMVRNVIAGDERPLPEWEHVGSFLGDGFRLFCVGAVYVIPFIAFALMVVVPLGFLGALENDGMNALGSGVAACLGCVLFPLSLFVMFFMPASLLFAAAEQRFGAGFEFSRIWAFIKSNIANYLLAVVVYLIARFLAGFGVMLLCIGVIFTAFWSILITSHAFAQVYRAGNAR